MADTQNVTGTNPVNQEEIIRRAMERIQNIHTRLDEIEGDVLNLYDELKESVDENELSSAFENSGDDFINVASTMNEQYGDQLFETHQDEWDLDKDGTFSDEEREQVFHVDEIMENTSELADLGMTEYGYSYDEQYHVLADVFTKGEDPAAYMKEQFNWQNVNYMTEEEKASMAKAYPGMTQVSVKIPGFDDMYLVGYDTSENVFLRQTENPSYVQKVGAFADENYRSQYYENANKAYVDSMMAHDDYFSQHPGEMDYVKEGLPDDYEPIVVDSNPAPTAEGDANVFEAQVVAPDEMQQEVPVQEMDTSALIDANGYQFYRIDGPTLSIPAGAQEMVDTVETESGKASNILSYIERDRQDHPDLYKDFPEKLYYFENDSEVPNIPGMTAVCGKIDGVPGYYVGYESYVTTFRKANETYEDNLDELNRQLEEDALSDADYTTQVEALAQEQEYYRAQYDQQAKDYQVYSQAHDGSYLMSADPLKSYCERTVGIDTSLQTFDETSDEFLEAATEEQQEIEANADPEWLANLKEVLTTLSERIGDWFKHLVSKDEYEPEEGQYDGSADLEEDAEKTLDKELVEENDDEQTKSPEYDNTVQDTIDEKIAIKNDKNTDAPKYNISADDVRAEQNAIRRNQKDVSLTDDQKQEMSEAKASLHENDKSAVDEAGVENMSADASNDTVNAGNSGRGSYNAVRNYANPPAYRMGQRPIATSSTQLLGRGGGASLESYGFKTLNADVLPDTLEKPVAEMSHDVQNEPVEAEEYAIPEQTPEVEESVKQKSNGKNRASLTSRMEDLANKLKDNALEGAGLDIGFGKM